jgi:hypothetical protein
MPPWLWKVLVALRPFQRVQLVCVHALQVDAGSDDEQQLLQGLPVTAAALSAAERAARQQSMLALSRGYRQRRLTHGDDRRQYDDDAEAAAAGVPSPHWDLHSVAESMQQVRRQQREQACPGCKRSQRHVHHFVPLSLLGHTWGVCVQSP